MKDCDLFAAVTNRDEINIIACQTAHALGARIKVARVRNEDYYEGNQLILDGIDLAINPDHEARRRHPRDPVPDRRHRGPRLRRRQGAHRGRPGGEGQPGRGPHPGGHQPRAGRAHRPGHDHRARRDHPDPPGRHRDRGRRPGLPGRAAPHRGPLPPVLRVRGPAAVDGDDRRRQRHGPRAGARPAGGRRQGQAHRPRRGEVPAGLRAAPARPGAARRGHRHRPAGQRGRGRDGRLRRRGQRRGDQHHGLPAGPPPRRRARPSAWWTAPTTCRCCRCWASTRPSRRACRPRRIARFVKRGAVVSAETLGFSGAEILQFAWVRVTAGWDARCASSSSRATR